MKVAGLKVEWTLFAKDDFKELGDQFKAQSPKSYQKVRKEIHHAIGNLSGNPERYPPDRFRANNDGSFRAFEKHSYRITYQIRQTYILILRIRHSKQMPLDY